MTLQLERHATQGSVAELELAQQLERRSKQPISHQAKLCQNSNLTLRTTIGKSRNLCGLTVSSFGTLRIQTAASHLGCWKFVLEVELPPFELQKTTFAKIHPSQRMIGEVAGQ